MRNDLFINAYQFIHQPAGKTMEKKTEDPLLTGRLEYELKTETPLFIPNTSSSNAFAPVDNQKEGHHSFDFFSYTNLDPEAYYDERPFMPVIPGSEIRGMLRNVYETLSGSCMSAVQSDGEFFSKRSMEYGKPGLIGFDRGKLFLYEARSTAYYEGPCGKGKWIPFYKICPIPEGARVTFNTFQDGKRQRARDVKPAGSPGVNDTGYLIKGEKGITVLGNSDVNEKYNCHIFVRNENGGAPMPISDQDWERFKRVLKSYADQKKEGEETPYKEYSEQLERFLEQPQSGEYFPVYYSKAGSSYYLSPSCVSREAYMNPFSNMIKDFTPCKSKEEACPACSLFGLTGEKTEDSQASRLRFSDLYPAEEKAAKDFYTEVTTLPALGQPRPSNTEFYLKCPEGADFVTYDYYIKDGEAVEWVPEIAGRKYYWHHLIKELPQAKERARLNRTIRAVKSENLFRGTIYFEKVTETELKRLIWLLTLNENTPTGGRTYGYKLGMGKPLGLGSVTLSLRKKQCVLRRVCDTGDKIFVDLSELFNEFSKPAEINYEETGFLKELKKEFLFMADLKATEGWRVSYPCADGEDKGYEWYKENHQGRRKGREPRRRADMITLEHLKRFEEIGQKEYDIRDFVLPVHPQRKKIKALSQETEETKQNKKAQGPRNVQTENRSSGNNSNYRDQIPAGAERCFWASGRELKDEEISVFRIKFLSRYQINKKGNALTREDMKQVKKSGYQAIAFPPDAKAADIEYAKKIFTTVIVAQGNEREISNWRITYGR